MPNPPNTSTSLPPQAAFNYRQLSPENGQAISRIVPWVPRMSRHLGKLCPRPGGIPLVNQSPNRLDDIVVLNRRALSRQPPVSDPSPIPLCHAVNGVLTVCSDLHRLGGVKSLKREEDGHELGALVGLQGAREAFGDVPGVAGAEVDSYPGCGVPFAVAGGGAVGVDYDQFVWVGVGSGSFGGGLSGGG